MTPTERLRAYGPPRSAAEIDAAVNAAAGARKATTPSGIVLPDGRRAIDVAAGNGIPYDTWVSRLRIGWDPLRAVTTPVRISARRRAFLERSSAASWPA